MQHEDESEGLASSSRIYQAQTPNLQEPNIQQAQMLHQHPPLWPSAAAAEAIYEQQQQQQQRFQQKQEHLGGELTAGIHTDMVKEQLSSEGAMEARRRKPRANIAALRS